MLPLLAQIFIGWPAILSSLALSVLGIVRRDSRWMIGGAALSLGFAWYLTGWPPQVLRTLGYALPFLHLGGGVAVWRGMPWVAWVLLLPHVLIASWLAAMVLTQ